MTQKTLHILNGDSLVPRLKDLAIDDDQLVWREMLCEGPTAYDLQSEEFQLKRVSYLEQYNTTETMYKNSFLTPLLTTDFHSYKNIILWFEYDLFCHINMLAALSHLRRLKVTATIYLVCSGWIDTDTNLKG